MASHFRALQWERTHALEREIAPISEETGYRREISIFKHRCAEPNHAVMVEQGGLQPLITLAYAADPDVHQQAAAALRGLACSDASKMKIVQEGALEPLTRLLASEDVEIVREVRRGSARVSTRDSIYTVEGFGLLEFGERERERGDKGVCLSRAMESVPLESPS